MRLRLLILILFIPFIVFPQTATQGRIRGYVNDAQTKEPLPFVNVVLEGDRKVGTITNDDGFFVLPNVNPGTYTLKVSLIGYETFTKQVTVVANRVINERISLKTSTQFLGEVEINAQKIEAQTKIQTGVISLNPKKIESFSAGGDADIMRAIQVLPGVVSTGDQGGQIFIRGGAPIQNLVLLDNMILYNPFHSIGFYSVFDPDIIRSADIYTAGFGAAYGSRNSSVMDFKTRNGSTERLTGKLSLSTFTSKVLLEGPIWKNPESTESLSFILSAKNSFLNRTDRIFYPYIESQFGGLPFEFNDYYGKVSFSSGTGAGFNAFGFFFDDAVTFDQTSTINWTQSGGGADFTIVPEGTTVIIDGNFGYTNYNINADFSDGQPRRSEVGGFNAGINFTYLMRKSDELKFGVQAIGYRTELLLTNPVGQRIFNDDNSTELAGYVSYRLNTGRFLVEPGLRLHYYASLSDLSFEPRLGAKYNLNEDIRIKASAGVYSQNLVAANSDRDVVNLFYGFLGGPTSIPSTFNGRNFFLSSQTAYHYIVGLEYDITRKTTLTIEGYLKDFAINYNLNRNKIYEEGTPGQPEELSKDFIIETGLASGIDFLLKYEEKRHYLWLAYSLARITRFDGQIEYFPVFDRRHNLNLVYTYTAGKNKEWEFNARYNFGTGFPFTPTQGNFVQLNFTNQFNQPFANYNFIKENGVVGYYYGELNSARLPNYHRFDISLKRTFKVAEYQRLDISAGATNLLNRNNIFYFDRLRARRVDQLPILPTVSVSYTF
ncbi:TonB-dependent receptor [Thermaurantimonas aggregans]|uniref:TonB-dependent receptor n=1 Tax=Thermaurantimonas aggregans TaxID=2173829 RepID=A0A401XLH5_9FLAO|nr:TonB-dependent receptor [Thermaurantimonas aggregans]MCX8149105.1 TonB-dependent receptor [Thermaurantimonas aggregans]GCD77853.1 TonB-dependent receptor [Thermaurantimonas aggregans]